MKLIHLLLPAFLLVAFTWTSCKKDDDTTDNPTTTDQQILAGQGLTSVKIGDTAQKAIDLFGTTQPSNASFNGQYTHFLIYLTAGVTVYCEPTTETTFNANMKISRFEMSSPFKGKTEKGIGIGSKKADVKAAYGEPSSSSVFFGDKYDSLGLTFVYSDTGDLVERIEVDKP